MNPNGELRQEELEEFEERITAGQNLTHQETRSVVDLALKLGHSGPGSLYRRIEWLSEEALKRGILDEFDSTNTGELAFVRAYDSLLRQRSILLVALALSIVGWLVV